VGSEGQTHRTCGRLTFLIVTEQLQFLIGVQGTHWEEGLGRRLVLDWNATVGREHAEFVDELVATNTEVDLAFLTEDTRLVVIAFTTKSWFWSTLGSRGNRGFGWLARSQMFQLFDESKVLGREAVLVVIQIDQTLANRTREILGSILTQFVDISSTKRMSANQDERGDVSVLLEEFLADEALHGEDLRIIHDRGEREAQW
jgi:hypothetical protein